MTPADCCTDQCNGGVCGAAPMCPSNGTTCGNCTAQKCCTQLTACLNDATCTQDIACFLQCTGNGGGVGQCFFQCVNNSPKATQVLVCLGTNCGNGVCF